MDFLTDSVEAISARVRSGEQSAREVTEHALDRIEALNPQINAFVAWDGERALAQADAVDATVAAGRDPGPLAGIPIGVKDLEAVEGFTTSFGSALHADDPPATADSVHVARFRAAGAVVIGKTNTPEYGHKGATDNPAFGTTANPWSLEHSPGGSSGGTGAAIASGMVAFHHIPGEINPADILSKHWGYSQVWEQLQPLLFWEGNTEDLFARGRSKER